MAQSLDPNNGAPSNQLAVVANLLKDDVTAGIQDTRDRSLYALMHYMHAVYYYAKALIAVEPFSTAVINLRKCAVTMQVLLLMLAAHVADTHDCGPIG